MQKYLLAAAVAMSLGAPAFAATQYYVAQNANDKKCEVTDTLPDGKTWMEIGKISYKARAEAEKALYASAECKSK